MSFHFWRTSFCPSVPDIDQMAPSPPAGVCRAYASWGSILSHLALLIGRYPAQNLCHLGESLLVSEVHQHDTKYFYGYDLEKIMWLLKFSFTWTSQDFSPPSLLPPSPLPSLWLLYDIFQIPSYGIFFFILCALIFSVSLTPLLLALIFINF